MRELSPTSTTARFEPALGCMDCFALDQCGGLYRTGVLDCLSRCCQQPDTCTYLCPRSKHFTQTWRDTNGINLPNNPLHQTAEPLPAYVPLIQHGSQRRDLLQYPIVALTTYDVTRRKKQTDDMIRNPVVLRTSFRLNMNTKIILSSIAADHELEYFWKERHHRRLIDGIVENQPLHVIPPNFSLVQDLPRFDNLANIKRSVICAEELSNRGISVIPYLAGITDRDWERWADFLKNQPRITMVCKEFQTGPRNRIIAVWHLDRLRQLQDRLGRKLHLIGIGARRHYQYIHSFAGTTVIDSVPFMRTMHRRILSPTGWANTATARHEPLDDLLRHNLIAYASAVAEPRRRAFTRRRPPSAASQNTVQLSLWPTGHNLGDDNAA